MWKWKNKLSAVSYQLSEKLSAVSYQFSVNRNEVLLKAES
jgi:hypothetical protein